MSRLQDFILQGEGYVTGYPVHYVIVNISINQSVGVYRPNTLLRLRYYA